MQLKPYQNTGVEFLKARKYALLGDDPGLGKSAQAIIASDAHPGRPVLVLCPAAVKYNWKKEVAKWRPQWSAHIIDTSKDLLPRGHHVYIINYDLLIRNPIFGKLRSFGFNLVICDESHRLKNESAKRTKKVLRKHGLLGTAARMWFLTGTPSKGRPMDLFPILSRCAPQMLKPYHSYLSFAYRYCGAYMGCFGLDTTGASRLQELHARIAPFMLRRRKTDVMKELPRRMLEIIELKKTSEIKSRIKQIEEETLRQAEEWDRDVDHLKLSEIARLRGAMAMFKVKPVAEYIRDLLESEEKVVVFYHHTKVRKALLEAFKYDECVTISGEDSPSQRPIKVNTFISNPKYRLLFGQIQACGEGVDGLQHGCSTCVFIEPSWSPTDIDQCISRLERMGQKEMVNAYIFIYEGTIEASMVRMMDWKQGVIDTLIEGNVKKPKPTKPEEDMYVEQRLEKLENLMEGLLKATQQRADAAAGNVDRATVATPEPAVNKATKKTTKKTARKSPPPPPPLEREEEEEGGPDVENEEITVDICRAVAIDVCKKYANETPDGKARVKAIVMSLGGGKLADLPEESLVECYRQLLGVLNGE